MSVRGKKDFLMTKSRDFYNVFYFQIISLVTQILISLECTDPDSSVGRVSAPGNVRSRVRSRATTYQSRKNGTSCFSLGTQTYGVELGLVDPVSG